MRIILIGYMGSGKTTVGQLLSLYLEVQFYDLDDYISTQEHDSIQSLFFKKGENYFRKIESYFLRSILKSTKKYVLSTGGGTPFYVDNFSLMKNLAQTVYLKLPPELIYQRLRDQKNKRPLISRLSDQELYEFIFQHFPKREKIYEQADYIVNILNESPSEIAHYIGKEYLKFVY